MVNVHDTEVLHKALELLQCGWTQKTFARNERMERVGLNDVEATCWCSVGAIARAAWELNGTTSGAGDIIRQVEKVTPGGNLVAFNDENRRTFEEIKAVFEAAICQ